MLDDENYLNDGEEGESNSEKADSNIDVDSASKFEDDGSREDGLMSDTEDNEGPLFSH